MFTYQKAKESMCLTANNALFLEEMFQRYENDRSSLPADWAAFFNELDGLDLGDAGLDEKTLEKQIKVLRLIDSYRTIGVRAAKLDPLERQPQTIPEELSLAYHGLEQNDLDSLFVAGFGELGGTAKLSSIIKRLEAAYLGTLSLEFMHISNAEQRKWLQERMENQGEQAVLDAATRISILERLTAAECLERYLHTRYVGQKRFSLEGSESLIPLLDHILHSAGSYGVKEIVLGMAHRGRLNVLVNVMGKLPRDLFAEFDGKVLDYEALSSGDVKYHKGFSSDLKAGGAIVHLSLAFNPSHLEIVSAVVEGSVRARQDKLKDESRRSVLPVVMHGDASFAGQGVVMETMNLSQTRGYRTGGSVHVVINNQIGFTTSDPRDCRSTIYCTDIAKMVEAPVIHVNADDPEAVVRAAQLALDFRIRFSKDVVIDLVCYRLRGHNEADEPMVTQPAMYKCIGAHRGTRQLYAELLAKEKIIDGSMGDSLVQAMNERLSAGESTARDVVQTVREQKETAWTRFRTAPLHTVTATGIGVERTARYGEVLSGVPDGFALHSRLEKIVNDRHGMCTGQVPIDWGCGEMLAYASLLDEGYSVRISGQDTARGTFFHRHAVFHDQKRERWDEGVHVPLAHLSDDQGHFTVIDSILSEEAVLAFEYGYATALPQTLTVWEAQFGDFANGAQVVIDQFITSGEAKWGRLCGLVMLLPHGFEGQGPEHSSARLERYLQLCAEENIQVCYPTTPAQMFHLLRRQMIRPVRKPLVVMTPKSLLRHKEAVSSLRDIAEGSFKPVIGETMALDNEKVQRLIFTTGKVYYDLVQARAERGLKDVVLIRLEEIYPFPEQAVAQEIALYPNVKEVLWVQEEPKNQGAFSFVRDYLEELIQPGQKLLFAGRPASAAPAVGYHAMHSEQLKALLEDAFRAR